MFRLDRIADMVVGQKFRPEPDKSLATFYAKEAARGSIPRKSS